MSRSFPFKTIHYRFPIYTWEAEWTSEQCVVTNAPLNCLGRKGWARGVAPSLPASGRLLCTPWWLHPWPVEWFLNRWFATPSKLQDSVALCLSTQRFLYNKRPILCSILGMPSFPFSKSVQNIIRSQYVEVRWAPGLPIPSKKTFQVLV